MSSSGFSANPFDLANANLRAGTSDREELARILGDAYADGKLGDLEYEERLDSALQIKLLGEVRTHLIDLGSPEELLKRPVTTREKATELQRIRKKRNTVLATSLGGWALLTVLMNIFWLLTVISYGELVHYWPIWVMLGVGVGTVSTSITAWNHARDQTNKVLDGRGGQQELPGPYSN